MTSAFDIKFSGSTDPFDEFFFDTHGGTKATWEVDEDECEFDEMNDKYEN